MPTSTIGLLAGMGPRSTAPFLELVLDECESQYGAKHDIDFPKLLICSLPVPFFPNRATDHGAMEIALRDGIRELAATGVGFIAMPCNTAHVYYSSLSDSIEPPLLNMIELTLNDIPSTGPRSIAVVAARPTVESCLYQRGIQERGDRVIDIDWQQDVDDFIESTRESKRADFYRNGWQNIVDQAISAGADTLLIGCMDLSAIEKYLTTEMFVVDAGSCLARQTIKYWRSQQDKPSKKELKSTSSLTHRGAFRISSNREEMDVKAICKYLTQSYWAKGISIDQVETTIKNSLCFGLFNERSQIGFARVVTDYVSFAYLCDVYVIKSYRGRGFGKWLVETCVNYPELKYIRRFMLATKDAHELYAGYGFSSLSEPARFMER